MTKTALSTIRSRSCGGLFHRLQLGEALSCVGLSNCCQLILNLRAGGVFDRSKLGHLPVADEYPPALRQLDGTGRPPFEPELPSVVDTARVLDGAKTTPDAITAVGLAVGEHRSSLFDPCAHTNDASLLQGGRPDAIVKLLEL